MGFKFVGNGIQPVEALLSSVRREEVTTGSPKGGSKAALPCVASTERVKYSLGGG